MKKRKSRKLSNRTILKYFRTAINYMDYWSGSYIPGEGLEEFKQQLMYVRRAYNQLKERLK